MKELEIVGVTKSYGTGSKKIDALQNISLSVQSGEILSILGLNGAGKTTLVKILSGLIDPDAGSVRLDGSQQPSLRAYRKRIGAVFEGNRNIYWRLSAYENLEYFGVLRGLTLKRARIRADAMLELFRLQDKRTTIALHLSRGMQQRLAVAISMVHEPELLVLDEPTLGVDIENVMQLVQTLKLLSSGGIAVIVTSHQFDVVKMIADRIAVIIGGKLVALESKAVFLASTPKGAYTLQLAEDLGASRQERLSHLGISVEEKTMRFPTDALYEVMDIVRPLSITSMSSGEDDLTQVFLQRIRGHKHA